MKEEKIVFALNSSNEDEMMNEFEVLTNENNVVQTGSEKIILELTEQEELNKLQTLENTSVSIDSMKIEARERENRLRVISQQLRTPSGLTNLEDIPAYKRNNIELEDTIHSSENEISTFRLDEENNISELNNNSFLHDNVD